MAKEYNTRTASLKATIADIRNLDAKQIKLKDKNILDYIKESEFNSYDTRDPQLKNDELDIWNTEISLSEEGHIEVKPHVHSVLVDFVTDERTLEGITESQITTLRTAVNVIDNEVLGENDDHIMYWQTNGLTNGEAIFIFSNLNSFNSDLPKLTRGYGMFSNCTNLNSFSSDLSSLTDGAYMLEYCTNLTTFPSDLSSLTEGCGMFYSCSNLTSFDSDLSSLTDGEGMFAGCSNLTSFSSVLSSLTNGIDMFQGCKLDARSVANIVHTLPTHESNGNITIGIGCDNTEADLPLFTQECDCETWQELLDEFSAKNWIVYFDYNGRPTTTYNIKRGETLPIYAKLEEVIMPANEKERKPYYQYTSVDGSKFFNINHFHSTNGSTEGYDVFSSLEEAISAYNVTPKN